MKTTKKLMTLLLVLLSSLPSFAQEYEYVPFVREGVKWVCDAPYRDYLGIIYHRYYNLELKGDTVIDGKCYKAMHKYSGTAINEENDTIPVYLREENKVVYGIVPDGKIYADLPIGMNRWPEAQEIIKSGQEFILYDFNDPINFIKNNVKYPVQGAPLGFFVDKVIPDQIVVAGKKVNRYIFGSAWCFIEGIGSDGNNCGYPLSILSNHLSYVIENGDTIYSSKYEESCNYEEESYWSYINGDDDRELPIPRQGVQWVNEQVTVDNGDTTSYYYKYEFRGYGSQGYALCYHYRGESLDNCTGKGIWAQYQSWDYGLDTSNGMIRYDVPYRKVLSEGRNMMSYYCNMGYDYWEMYHFHNYPTTDIEYCYTPNWYIYHQLDNYLNRENIIEVEPLMIEGIKCHRYAYIGEQGDTLAYIVQGIGFDSRNMGDLLTPFTKQPNPNAKHQEWCGLSHVVKDGKIIYKGMRYRHGAFDGIDEVEDDQRPRQYDDNYYNLMGLPVGKTLPTAPGIYIHHGIKVVVR